MGVAAIQFPSDVSGGQCNGVQRKYTFSIPILTTFVASLEKLLGGWPQKGDHLGKVEFIVQMAVLNSAKESTSFKQVPNLHSMSAIWDTSIVQ